MANISSDPESMATTWVLQIIIKSSNMRNHFTSCKASYFSP